MKKIILTLAIAVSSLFAFAGDVNENALNAFNTEFANAKEVRWNETNGVYKVSFVHNNQYVSAFYTTEGELMGVARNISSLDLPKTLQNKLKIDYADFWISGLSEVSAGDDTDYYITMENADAKVILKSNGKKWNVVKKITKA
jgi:hypothetical protein